MLGPHKVGPLVASSCEGSLEGLGGQAKNNFAKRSLGRFPAKRLSWAMLDHECFSAVPSGGSGKQKGQDILGRG